MKIRLHLAIHLFSLLLILYLTYELKEKIFNKIAHYLSADIVMFGDSITYSGDWMQGLSRIDVINSGKSSFTTSHFVSILNNSVLMFHPKICFLEGGINDIGVGIPLKRTYHNYTTIVDTLLSHNIEPVLQSTLYINQTDDTTTNSKVDSLNAFLQNLALSRHLHYINLNQHLSSNKQLKQEYTTDGVHLEEDAYKFWFQEVKKTLQMKNI